MAGLCAATLTACGQATDKPPTGPYATPEKSAPQAVALRGCVADHPASATELDLLRTQLIRQGTDLQRVDDDLTGAVPGGDLPIDTDLALKQAQQMIEMVTTSSVCPALKDPVATRLRALLAADAQVYQSARQGGDVAGALATARAAFADLQAYLAR
jgi:hypothetical protein